MDREQKIEEFIKQVKLYVGVPFRHQGRDKNGIDCVGLIVTPLNNMGFFTYDNKNYKRYGLGGEIHKVMKDYCYEVDNIKALKRGDILLFSKGNSQHLGVFTGYSIIHSNNIIGKVVEHDLTDEWTSLITKVYRYKEE